MQKFIILHSNNIHGRIDPAWGLKASYEVQAIMRDVIEDYLKGKPPISVEMGRLDLS